MSTPKDVDSYIAGSASDARPILEELRRILTSTLPSVDENIRWGVPFYRYHGALGGYATYKNHVSFGCQSELRSDDRELLESQGYRTGKKTVQIAFDQPVPTSTIKRIVRAQAKLNEARSESGNARQSTKGEP